MNNFFERLDAALGSLVGFLWGPPLVTLLVGGGLFFLLYSRLLPYRHLPDGVRLLFRPADSKDEGTLSHFQAL
ncbi:MAG TPA: sodium/alanine symporter, partial [Alcanivorax sp.]|nr:sodium/alanine symporter [Alcanivorax sp.]